MDTVASLLLLTLSSCVFVATALPPSGLEEQRLIDYLRSNAAHPLARPVLDATTAVNVTFQMFLNHLELDEKAETFYARSWFRYSWTDSFLKWSPANYSGIQSVRLPLSSIWYPDLRVFNSKTNQDHQDTRVVIHNDGSIMYFPSVHTSTSCNVDLTYFPFDSQRCILVLGSWIYSAEMVNITMPEKGIDSVNYTPNKAWRLVSVSSERIIRKYSRTYIKLKFIVTLARQSSYFTYVYVGPVAILSLLGSAIFILPPGNSQKMTLGGALLICYGLFFLEISYIMPPVHSSTPLIDKYYMAMYMLLALSVVLAAIVTNIAKRCGTHNQPPDIVTKVIVEMLGRCLCISDTSLANVGGSGGEELSDVKAETASVGGTPSVGARRWYLISFVLDRLFLILYAGLTILVSFSILMNFPNV